MTAERSTSYSPVLLPALHRIQQQFGYLKQEALEEFSKQTGVPHYRLQAIATHDNARFPRFLELAIHEQGRAAFGKPPRIRP